VADDRDREGLVRTSGRLLGLPARLLRPVPDTANRFLAFAETEMPRNLDKEFRAMGSRRSSIPGSSDTAR
jgi:hypothetical protein